MSKCTMYRLEPTTIRVGIRTASRTTNREICSVLFIPPIRRQGKDKTKERRPHSLFPNTNRLSLLPFPFCLGPLRHFLGFDFVRKGRKLFWGKETNRGGTKKTLSSREEEEICRHPSLLFPTNPRHFFTFFLLATRVGRRRGTNDASLLAEQGCKAEGGRRRGKIYFPLLILLSTYGLLYLPFASRQVHEFKVYTGMDLLLWPMIYLKSWSAHFHGVRVASNDKTCWQILILAWPGWLHYISARDCKKIVHMWQTAIRIIEKANNWSSTGWN